MKKVFLFVMIICTVICASAQQYKVYRDNGTHEILRINGIDSIVFKSQGRLPKVMFYKNTDGLKEFSAYDIDSIKASDSPSDNGYDYVDLGLPSGTLWATCNIGASSPEEYGDYFAWGETKTKSAFNWNNYFDTYDGGKTFIKYNPNGGKTVLDIEDDAAHVIWGGDWRIPSDEIFAEISDVCSWENCTVNGVFGKKVIGPNGNTIFFPAAGSIYDYGFHERGNFGYYQSRTLDISRNDNACYYYLNRSDVVINRIGDERRYNGLSIRPVIEPKVESIAIEENLYIEIGEKKQLRITTMPYGSSDDYVWESNNESVATVSQNGIVTGVSEGETTITITTADGRLSATCKVIVSKPVHNITYFDYITGVDGVASGHINTLVYPTNNYQIDCELTILGFNSESVKIIGLETFDNPSLRIWLNNYGLWTSSLISEYGTEWSSGWNHYRLNPGHYKLRFKDKGYIYDLSSNNVLCSSAGSRTFSSQFPFLIFNYTLDQNGFAQHLIQLGHTKIYDGSKLQRDLLPCKYDDEIGMYDMVNNEFLPLTGTGKVGNWDEGSDNTGDNNDGNEDEDNYDITKYVTAARTGQGTKVDGSGAYCTVTFTIYNNSTKTIHLQTLAGVDISRDLSPNQSCSITLQSKNTSLRDYYQTLIYTYNGKSYSLQV